ncbi:MAG TPA: CapA family protein [Thermomicrobiales bacterium]|nr:CapA family protein [Thermomicrobiales bacterium]
MSTTPADGMQHLRQIAASLQQARTTRHALLQGTAALTATTALGTAPAHAAPDQPPVRELVVAQGVAAGACLVTSRRLPLAGIAADQPAPLLQGDLTDWAALGLGGSLPVTVLVVDPHFPEGVTPAETLPDYAALVAALDRTPGGVAMLPLELVDARVQVLDLDGVSPLLATGTTDAPIVRIGVAGDIIFGRNGGNYQMNFDDWLLPAYQVKDFLSTFDVTVANFECFVSDTIDLSTVDNLDFVTRPESLQGMVLSGIDSVTMANNHAVFSFAGYGIPGMQETMSHLNAAGITPWGVGMDLDEARAPWVTEVNGVSIAFYGVDGVTANLDYPNAMGVQGIPADVIPVDARADRGGTNPLKLDQNLADIEELAGKHDIVLPYFHMGDQYVWTPRDWVVEVSRRCIDAGATAVLSAHPHATMGMEIYQGKPIFYSIGNFIYDQMFSLETREGYFLDLTLRGKDLIGFRIHPTEVVDFVQPRFLSPRETVRFNDRFWRSIDLTRAQFGDWS